MYRSKVSYGRADRKKALQSGKSKEAVRLPDFSGHEDEGAVHDDKDDN